MAFMGSSDRPEGKTQSLARSEDAARNCFSRVRPVSVQIFHQRRRGIGGGQRQWDRRSIRSSRTSHFTPVFRITTLHPILPLPKHTLTPPAKSYSSSLFPFLRDVQTPDSPIGIYLSTRNGGFLNRATLELVLAVEAAVGRGKAVLLIHDATKALEASDVSVKAYVLSEAARGVARDGKWDGASYVYFWLLLGLIFGVLERVEGGIG